MDMRRTRIAVTFGVACALLVMIWGWAPSSEAASVACAPADAHVVAADVQAEVYIAQEPYFEAEGKHEQLGTERAYRGCVYGSSRSFRLGIISNGSSGGIINTDHVTLSGVDVAYETIRAAGIPGGLVEHESYLRVVVRNLRTGGVIHQVADGVPLEAMPKTVGVGGVEAIVLKSDGAVAWIAQDELRSEKAEQEAGRTAGSYYDLYVFDKTGERLLASGTELDRSSLALAGSTLYWTLGGKPFSALLQ
jgi:hypothetical protein